MKKIVVFIALFALPTIAHADAPPSRFFIGGDGKINIAGRGASFNGTYRKADGSYDEAAMKRINAIYGSRHNIPGAEITPRLVEFLDFLQDELSPGRRITVRSGYRSPRYNTGLRNKGRLAAKASLHQYAMAADIRIDGVSSKRVWDFIKELGYGGAGYYHGSLVHVDVGPARSWDETTSGVGTDISDDNKLVDLMTDRDIYFQGEPISMQITRMTAFPIGVSPVFTLERADGEKMKKPIKITSSLSDGSKEECPKFSSIESLANATARLPNDIPPGRYRVKATFCEKEWESMPDFAESREIEIRRFVGRADGEEQK
ncbi:MAG TPA: DUF882 domain-containing protein [bacterium]|nr:DUF882 domain-containing protein [bacterium]